ncbi:MAG: type VI secretion system protein TssA [Pseudomonadota bacterium]
MFSAEALLHPISADQPSGQDMAFSSELDAISLARRFDDPSLDQGEWVTELKEADWDYVAKRCAALLAEKSKDLRLAVWLTEASAKQDHLRGLGEGYLLLAGLCEQFWDTGLYPEAEDGDQDQRIGNLSWILGRTPTLVRAMPLTEGRGTQFSTIDFEAARKKANSGERADTSGAPKLSDMEAARQKNSPQFMARFSADARYCLDALLKLEQAADARLGQDSPGFSAAKDALENMLRVMPAPAAAKPDPDTHDGHGHGDHGAIPAGGTLEHGGQPHAAPSGPPGSIQNRNQALRQLRLVAEFFRRTEPHSPVSYFADKAADAGEQSLHDWLRSVVKDSASMQHIEELLGVKPPND